MRASTTIKRYLPADHLCTQSALQGVSLHEGGNQGPSLMENRV